MSHIYDFKVGKCKNIITVSSNEESSNSVIIISESSEPEDIHTKFSRLEIQMDDLLMRANRCI